MLVQFMKLLSSFSWISTVANEHSDSKRRCEKKGTSFMMPVIVYWTVSLSVITLPNASASPKNFLAAVSVSTTEKGSRRAVATLPSIIGNVNILKNEGSAQS